MKKLLLICVLIVPSTINAQFDYCAEKRTLDIQQCKADFDGTIAPTCLALLVTCGCIVTGIAAIPCAIACLGAGTICGIVSLIAVQKADICMRRANLEYAKCKLDELRECT